MRRLLLAILVIGPWFMPASLLGADNTADKSGAERITVAPSDWPWWRGPARDGIAASDQNPPLKWSATTNVAWKSPVPGRGHGSPTVVGNQVFLAAADQVQETQSVLCYDRKTGNLLWQTPVHRGSFDKKGNRKSSLASSTVACDGERIFVNFLHAGAVYTTALDRDGHQIWQTKITDFVVHQGFGSSPALYRSLVIVTADNKGTGAVAALDRVTGKIVWKQQRPSLANYTSPIILNAAGHDQLFLTGCDLVAGLDPLSGKKFWEVPGSTTECVTSTVTDGQLIFTSGGYPRKHMSAVRADGTGTIAWDNNTRLYVPSLLVHQGDLYGVLDAGMAMCWKCTTGKELWKARLGGVFSASPVLVGDHVYATNESGRTFIFKATPKAFEQIGENQLGDEMLATPAICGGHIFMRLGFFKDGQRQEMLYSLGN